MGFWEDASPAVKGAIVVGGILALIIGVGWLGGIGPWAAEPEATQVRGLQRWAVGSGCTRGRAIGARLLFW